MEHDITTKPATDSTANEATPAAFLQEASLRELITARVVTGLVARGGAGGFVLEIGIGERHVVLANARGSPRVFASVETIATLLRRLGRLRFEVDATDYAPGRVRAARPDRSLAMKSIKVDKPTSAIKRETIVKRAKK